MGLAPVSTTAAAAAGGAGTGVGSRGAEAGVPAVGGGGGGVDVEELSPVDLQGSHAEDGHLSGLSDLEGLIEDQDLPESPPFGPVTDQNNSPLARAEAAGEATAVSAVTQDTLGSVSTVGGSNSHHRSSVVDEGLDEDAFVAALLDA